MSMEFKIEGDDELLPDAEATERLKAGKSIRRKMPKGSMGVSIRKHRNHGWMVEGFTDGPEPGCPVNVHQGFTLKPPGFKWPPVKWTQEDAIEAALRSYRSGAPF